MIIEIIITTLVGLILGAYAVVFKMIIKRLEKIEEKQESRDIHFLEIKTALAKIQADLEWIKKRK